jgi:hypothetical protein
MRPLQVECDELWVGVVDAWRALRRTGVNTRATKDR